ncbi:MFS transporter [uncultured Mucilaginibacter sp.]|uniref:MFS transporter n=1 Tax=uncultured Mucilaginibacter sp. TaxID=797541 RepID=UPI0025D9B586|nr:MFS transporter [uncultured Mucilaginibacter sp.]
MRNTPLKQQPLLTPSLLWVMAIATGLVVANIYYNQPLLKQMEGTFKITEGRAQLIAVLTQMGYAAGMLLLLPLADMLERKRLMMFDFVLIVLSLLGAAFAPNMAVMLIASFFIGLSSMIPQMLIPMAAHLTGPENRGKTVGFVMSGLLMGILLSRTLSGYIGAHFGWRTMFIIAAALMLVLWVLLYFMLPTVEAEYDGNYGSLMRSMLRLIKTEPKLRLAALRGALGFACFSAFWTTLTFLLSQPQFKGNSQTAGYFGLVGAFGALGASVMGRLSDRVNPYKLTTVTILLIIVSYVVFSFSGSSMIGLVIGVILLDLGVQSTHISNQTMVFGLNPHERNRLNTVYIVCYFLGGSLGTYLASAVWNRYHWNGVCAIGLGFSTTLLLVHLFSRRIAVTT